MIEVFYNLLLNAIQSFSPSHPDPTILIAESPSNDAGWVCIIIRDNSVGIKPERLAQVQAMFNNPHITYDNQGLGLTLVQFLVRQMGGQIGIDSVVGEGTTVWLRFPAPTPYQYRTYAG